MKSVIVLETATELVTAASRVCHGPDDKQPTLPNGAKLLFENDLKCVQLRNAPGFMLCDGVDVEQVLTALCKHAGFGIYIT